MYKVTKSKVHLRLTIRIINGCCSKDQTDFCIFCQIFASASFATLNILPSNKTQIMHLQKSFLIKGFTPAFNLYSKAKLKKPSTYSKLIINSSQSALTRHTFSFIFFCRVLAVRAVSYKMVNFTRAQRLQDILLGVGRYHLKLLCLFEKHLLSCCHRVWMKGLLQNLLSRF